MRNTNRKAGQRPLKATHEGVLNLGGHKLVCAVLENGKRIVEQTAIAKAIGFTAEAEGSATDGSRSRDLPDFLAAANLKPFVDYFLTSSQAKPIAFQRLGGGIEYGYSATMLPLVLGIYCAAQLAGELQGAQLRIGENCMRLLSALTAVGKVALDDEVTGAQTSRAPDALQKRLAKELGQ